jgi:SnoaL-like domain
VNGDRAKGKWLLYMMYCYPRTGQSLFWVQGFYNMEYVRENGKWKISYMNWTERMGLPGGGPPQGLW